MEQSQGMGGGYDNLTQSQTDSQHDMGGGQGIKGSGVAGGYTGSGGSQAQAGAQGAQAEKQDWLDKGISMAGKKFGVNVSQENADKAGDFVNKEFNKREGGSPSIT
ncbi:hypothetical protein NLI96_g7944 [Meripilus lineatus]|uniref:Uncharacterized protein n=1 Tax=Meripilus lineatus TaxID=2056292 RepID=A0AAD5YCG8_9APHY|nr:hypothetical protein NLI96_g7944 [Physisporinus lineatus]